MYKIFGKRLFDIIVSFVLLVLFIPLLVITYIIVYIKIGNPCIFQQKRPGYLGKTFTVYKFRTMKNLYDAHGVLLDDKHRITKLGAILRKLSIDELPELFNVLIGNMSLVGPRPLLTQYLSRYNQKQLRRHDVLPGITGWAQIKGRNAISWEEKFNYDLWYIEHMSLTLDIKILLLTVYRVLKRENINSDSSITMSEFMGSDN
jgi:sugar transferase EpsL